jgi:tetratricopeptide (TPR) repeat protein
MDALRAHPLLVLFWGIWLVPGAALPQHSHCDAGGPDYVDPAFLEKPTTLKEGIGKVTQKVSTKSRDAQAFYDQGLAYLHSYVWTEAARSFHQALRSDPDCAMAWMGLARAEDGLQRKAEARAAIREAQKRSARATAREKRFIALRAEQLRAVASPTLEEEKRRHEAYKKSLDAALAAFPDDAELWIWRGNAQEPGSWGRGQIGGSDSIPYYEKALARSPGHFGAEHYLAHSYENIGQPAKAAEYAKLYSSVAPEVAHAQHMYGHALPRLGRWEESLEQFQKADAIEERQAREENLRPGDDWHHAHNLQLLGFTYLRLGRLAEAERTFERLAAIPIRDPMREWQHASLAEFYLVTGRPSDALAAASPMEKGSVSARAAGSAVCAEALLALGRLPEARAAAERAAAAHAEKSKMRGQDAFQFEGTVGAFVSQAQAEVGLSGAESSEASQQLIGLADSLAGNTRFDGWGEGLFRIERMAQAAERVKLPSLAEQLRERGRRIDPGFTPAVLLAKSSPAASR